jgi:hypothetical protein
MKIYDTENEEVCDDDQEFKISTHYGKLLFFMGCFKKREHARKLSIRETSDIV